MAAKALLVISAFVLQTLLVFAGNSRLFGLLQPGSGWYTNVEMSQRCAPHSSCPVVCGILAHRSELPRY